MMKFFRKYNKHLLAVFGVALLIIWLGGSAFQAMFEPDRSKDVIGRANTGVITRGDQERAEARTKLQEAVGLSWRARFGGDRGPGKENLALVDWILLLREAERLGVRVSPDDARRIIENGGGANRVKQVAARQDIDVSVDRMYRALADYLTVDRLVNMVHNSMNIPEPMLRNEAMKRLEKASIEAVKFPATSFTDPSEEFSDDEIRAQFEAHKDQRTVEGGMTFGYFQEDRVRIQYIQIDPGKIEKGLSDDDSRYLKRALEYWQQNKNSDPRFKRSEDQLAAARSKMPADLDQEGYPIPARSAAPFCEKFEEAQQAAIDIIKEQTAKAEADRVATTLLRMLAEPWFGTTEDRSKYKPAPQAVKSLDYYDEVVSRLPDELSYHDAIRVALLDFKSADELRDTEAFGPLAQYAFLVQGLTDIPKETDERNLFKSLWQTHPTPVAAPDGTVLLYRVIDVKPEHAPSDLDEVREQVIADLRKVRGYERAREAAEAFVKSATEKGFKEAWDEDTELSNRVTPDKGGYVKPRPFSHEQLLIGQYVVEFGQVNDGFMDTAFRLAKEGDASGVEVVELPEQSMIVAMKGVNFTPVYEEQYVARRQQFSQQLRREYDVALLDWLSPKQIRERNGYQPGEGA